MTQNKVKFRYGSGVTANSPDLLPGAFTFDSNTFALYLDNNQERLQIQDPLKLSITGGNMSGDIRVMNNGLVSCSLNAQSGEIRGVFFTTTGEISIETPPGKYAVIDDNGRIRYITKQQVLADLGIDNYGYDSNTTYTPPKLGFCYVNVGGAANDPNKIGTNNNYVLSTGGIVVGRFLYDAPAGSTLNISGRGAKPIYFRNAALPAGVIKGGDTVSLVYYPERYYLMANDRWQVEIDSIKAQLDALVVLDEEVF